MRILAGVCALIVGTLTGSAQLSISGAPAVQDAFGGRPSELHVWISNPVPEATRTKFSYRIFQLTSSIAAPKGDMEEWKELDIPAGQTVRETFPVQLPEVRTTSIFRVQFLDPTGKPAGAILVRTHPTNALAALKEIIGGGPVGVITDNSKLADTLRAQGLEVEEYTTDRTGNFTSRLLLLDGRGKDGSSTATLRSLSRKLANKETAVIFLTNAPGGGMDRLNTFHENTAARAELALQPASGDEASAAFASRLIEAVRTLFPPSSSDDSPRP